MNCSDHLSLAASKFCIYLVSFFRISGRFTTKLFTVSSLRSIISTAALLLFLTQITVAQDSLYITEESRIFDYWGSTRGMAIHGDIIYVATSLNGLKVVDVSDPDNPNLLRTLPDIRAQQLEIHGDYLYVEFDGLKILDISDPINPILVGEMQLGAFQWVDGFCISYPYVYIFLGPYGLHTVNISIPEYPFRVVYEEFGETIPDVSKMVVRGDTLFVSSSGKLSLFSLENPDNPAFIGEINNNQIMGNFFLFENLVYLRLDTDAIGVLDLSLPFDEASLSEYQVGDYIGIALSGDFLIVWLGYGIIADFNVNIYSLRTPTLPDLVLSGTLPPEYTLSYLLRSGSYLWSSFWGVSSFTFDQDGLYTGGAFQNFGVSLDVHVDGETLYSANGKSGVYAFDISNPLEPQITDSLMANYFNRVTHISTDEELLFVSNHETLHILETSPSLNEISSIVVSFYVAKTCAENNTLFLAASSEGVLIYDISDPTNPTQLATIPCEGYNKVTNVNIYNGYLFASFNSWDTKLNIYDISDPASPLLVQSIPDITAYDIEFYRSACFIGTPNGTLVYGTATLPELDSLSFMEVERAKQIALFDDYLLSCSLDGSLFVYDISNLEQPEFVGAYDEFRSRNGLAVKDNVLYTANNNNIDVISLITSNGVNPAGETTFPTTITFALYPNPFNSTVKIDFALPQKENVSVKVFDLLGRQITTLADEPFLAGSHTLNWDATGMASGTYFIKLVIAEHTFTRQILYLK